jgi:DNA-binding IclR family transcriptional regulator
MRNLSLYCGNIIKSYVLFLDQIVRLHRLGAVSVIGVEFPLQSAANGKAYNREEHMPGLCAAGAVVYAPIDAVAAISIYDGRRELK